MGRCLALLCCLLSLSVSGGAVQLMLDRRAIEEAIALGQSHQDAERYRFHTLYRLMVARPPVDWIDIITPYHRVVLAAEARTRIGNRIFGQREALAALNAAPNQLELLVEMTFHPLNTFVGVPSYEVTLIGPRGMRIQPRRLDRFPRFGPRTDSAPALPVPNAAPILGLGQPVSGGLLLVQFSADDLDANGRYDVVMAEAGKEGKELARASLDLAKMR
jgi:hypothetical protein